MYIYSNTKFIVLQKLALVIVVFLLVLTTGCTAKSNRETVSYDYAEIPLERNNIALHLDRMCLAEQMYEKNILFVHGLTYSSHEFDIDYEDYSLVRYFVRKGYTVWRIDIAGYGNSGAVEDGFLPDSDYAALDVCEAVEKICETAGKEKIDILGWSWGTVISSHFAYVHPEYINKLVLYAPIFTGLGYSKITDPFHKNDWEHAADDFQKKSDGTFDFDITEKEIIEIYCSSCWHYDGTQSPNGGRKDLCVDESEILIEPGKIKVPTCVICGDSDPYMNLSAVNGCIDILPDGSDLEIIKGASHVMMYEKPYYHTFRDKVIAFLEKEE